MTQFNPYEEEEVPHRKYFGKYKGFVRTNDDPDGRGRIRCFCPAVMGPNDSEDTWLGWAEGSFPWLGGISVAENGPPFTQEQQVEIDGREYIGVWLEFEAGDPDFPIWTGTFPIAPKREDGDSLQSTGGEGLPGGGVLGNPALPSSVLAGPLNPPKPVLEKEVRLRAPQGRDMVFLVDGGGSIIVGPSGVHLVGIQVTANGKQFLASVTEFLG